MDSALNDQLNVHMFSYCLMLSPLPGGERLGKRKCLLSSIEMTREGLVRQTLEPIQRQRQSQGKHLRDGFECL